MFVSSSVQVGEGDHRQQPAQLPGREHRRGVAAAAEPHLPHRRPHQVQERQAAEGSQPVGPAGRPRHAGHAARREGCQESTRALGRINKKIIYLQSTYGYLFFDNLDLHTICEPKKNTNLRKAITLDFFKVLITKQPSSCSKEKAVVEAFVYTPSLTIV